MINYKKLGISDSVLNSFNIYGIRSDFDVLVNLEQYHYISRSDVLNFLNENTNLDFKNIPDDIIKYKDVVYSISNECISVYCNPFTEVDKISIELDLIQSEDKEIEFFYATPYDFSNKYGILDDLNPDLVLQRIVREAISKRATDIHFDVKHINKESVYTVQFRIGLNLVDCNLFKIDSYLNSSIISRLIEHDTAISSMDLLDPAGVVANSSNPLGDKSVELRISANKVLDGYHYVIRLQEKKTVSLRMDELGFNANVIADLDDLCTRRSGLTLITGAIRTGKNTTAFAMANTIVETNTKIISYESPVEVLMPFTQVDYSGNEIVLSNAVRLAKKQDVNIAFLNEIPDKTVAFAVQDLVNSSIHVITTMHINRLWHIPYKLEELYGDDYKNLISQLNGLINQKMFVLACPHCLTKKFVNSLPSKYASILNKYNIDIITQSNGCDQCNNTGLQHGKIQPYAEHLIFDDQLQTRLLRCSHAYEMENIIREELVSKKQDLESYLVRDISAGVLPISALDSLR